MDGRFRKPRVQTVIPGQILEALAFAVQAVDHPSHLLDRVRVAEVVATDEHRTYRASRFGLILS